MVVEYSTAMPGLVHNENCKVPCKLVSIDARSRSIKLAPFAHKDQAGRNLVFTLIGPETHSATAYNDTISPVL